MRKKVLSLKEILLNYAKTKNNKGKSNSIEKIKEIWNKLILNDAIEHIYVYKLEREILYVWADGSDWASYLRMESENIKNIIKTELNINISEIKVSVRFFKKFKPTMENMNNFKQLTKKEIENIKKSVSNEELFGYLFYAIYKKNKGD